MDIEIADWRDILKLLRETYKLWSAGLSKEHYYGYQQWQLNHPWARQNYRYLVYRNHSEVLASLKLYRLDFACRSKSYQIAGVGALYTPERFRGNGYGSRMLKSVAQWCKLSEYDGLLLYSDIGEKYYERLGFEALARNDFSIMLNNPAIQRSVLLNPGLPQKLVNAHMDLETPNYVLVQKMMRSYQHWLALRTYGIRRTELYWHFKLARENYLHKYSRRPWPKLELISCDKESNAEGYALYEQGEKALRVFEVIGRESVCESLWQQILATALLRNLNVVRGWEGAAPNISAKLVPMTARSWGFPMLLALTAELKSWAYQSCCPLLELDYL